jgi:dihydroxy-acid dehydratase
MSELNKYSKGITQNETQPASQAMLYALGIKDEDLKKAQVGIVSTGFQGNPCNMHLNGLAEDVKKSIDDRGLWGLIFHTIGVSDGIPNGTEGMKYSLPSRDIIADSIETVVNAQHYDAVVPIVGCDKNMPGAIMAMGRMNRNIVSAFEAYGKKLKGDISNEDYKGIIKNSIPGAGACGGMYTANTMSSAIEALGMSLPYSSSNPAVSDDKRLECAQVGEAIENLLIKDIKPREIMTRRAFENAITLIMALGGSTNAVLHLIAMAKAVDIELGINDFQRISDNTPFIADLKPSGQYLMEDLHYVGGVPAVMRYLMKEGLMDGDCMTVTGKTLGENLETARDLDEGQKIITPLNKAIKPVGHIQILFGNLAREGAVAKITGKEGERFTGTARVFDNEFEAIDGIDKTVKKGDVIVIRYEGPKGAPGMPEMLKPTGAVIGAGLGKDVALITDGRFSGGSHGFVVGHITPEAQEGGLIALIEDGDKITIDAVNNRIDVDLSDEEIRRRRENWVKPPYKYNKGILGKYIKLVSSASEGCVTD